MGNYCGKLNPLKVFSCWIYFLFEQKTESFLAEIPTDTYFLSAITPTCKVGGIALLWLNLGLILRITKNVLIIVFSKFSRVYKSAWSNVEICWAWNHSLRVFLFPSSVLRRLCHDFLSFLFSFFFRNLWPWAEFLIPFVPLKLSIYIICYKEEKWRKTTLPLISIN